MNHQRTALVIGAKGHIGQAITGKLESENVHVFRADLGYTPSTSDGFFVNVADEQSVINLHSQVLEHTPHLDIVINCSGILEEPIDTIDVSFDAFQKNLSVNLIGPFLISKIFIPTLLQSTAGRLIHFSSMLGTEGGPRLTAYSTSKAGITGLVKSLGKEYAKTALTVNAVAPSAVDTEMLHSLGKDRVQQQLSLVPMGRAAQVEEVAHLVNYIASPETSFTTGYIFDLSGGRSVY